MMREHAVEPQRVQAKAGTLTFRLATLYVYCVPTIYNKAG